jgi:hypothetical protein
MENLAKVMLVPMDYDERRERVVEAIITYLNYDAVSDERWHSPFENEDRQARIRKDAERIADITLEYYKLELK